VGYQAAAPPSQAPQFTYLTSSVGLPVQQPTNPEKGPTYTEETVQIKKESAQEAASEEQVSTIFFLCSCVYRFFHVYTYFMHLHILTNVAKQKYFGIIWMSNLFVQRGTVVTEVNLLTDKGYQYRTS
jgi:hypothetical protein